MVNHMDQHQLQDESTTDSELVPEVYHKHFKTTQTLGCHSKISFKFNTYNNLINNTDPASVNIDLHLRQSVLH